MEDFVEALARVVQPGVKPGKQVHQLLNHLRAAPYDRDDPLQFLAYAIAMAPRAKGQLFQDVWAHWASGQKRGGYFVEFGAADGVYLSNTFLLEREMGWRGILAEPNPAFHAALARNRRCIVSHKCVYSRSGAQLEFIASAEEELSRLADLGGDDAHEATRRKDSRSITVETVSLNDLLLQCEAPAFIDYLSIDTEGSEFEILSAFDFERWRIGAISVEHNNTAARAQIHELLTARGYRRQWPQLSRFDDWYVRA